MYYSLETKNIKNEKIDIIYWKFKIWYYLLETVIIKNKKFGIIHWKWKTLKIKNLVLFIGNEKH